MVGAALTDIAGSSDVFSGGFITYSADAKKSQLEVSGEILETFVELSLATAWAMAAGALTNSDADVEVAITGIAGPGGRSVTDPVGQVALERALRGPEPDDYFPRIFQFLSTARGASHTPRLLFSLDLSRKQLGHGQI